MKLYNKDKNEGMHASRLQGNNSAKGKYLLLLDQDDEITDDFFYNAHTSIDENDVLIINGYKEINSNNKEKIYTTKADIKKFFHKKSFLFRVVK